MLDFSAVYAAQENSARLQLKPVFKNIEEKVTALEDIERADFWERIGRYICENAWQLAFRADLLLQGGTRGDNDKGHYRCLELYDRSLRRPVNSRAAVRLTACASRLWLKYMARD
jgi:hypothetical protein